MLPLSTNMGIIARTNPLIAIIGPTGTGKSMLAIRIAELFNGEVINADALQMYKGLPLATNKISNQEMRGIKHHLLGHIDFSEAAWHVKKFVAEADKIIGRIISEGKLPIVVGGTHFYVHSLLFRNDPLSYENTEQFDEEARIPPSLLADPSKMLDKLRELDPVAASWWHPNEPRKIQRSLEICLSSGQKVSEIYEKQKLARKGDETVHIRYKALCLYLHAERVKLTARLNDRVDRMIGQGLLDEVRFMRQRRNEFRKAGLNVDEGRGIWTAIGFKDFGDYLDALSEHGENSRLALASKESACESMKAATRQYAVRQSRYAKNKILNLYEGGSKNLLQLLDASDDKFWVSKVAEPAENMVVAYLNEAPMPVNKFRDMTLPKILSSPQIIQTHTCDTCHTTTTTPEAWEAHLQGRRHKKLMRHLFSRSTSQAVGGR